jgi:hypothetical protein
MATISSQTKGRRTADLVVRAVDLREVTLAQQVREFEDVVLDLFVDWAVGAALLLFYHYLYKLILSAHKSTLIQKKFLITPNSIG